MTDRNHWFSLSNGTVDKTIWLFSHLSLLHFLFVVIQCVSLYLNFHFIFSDSCLLYHQPSHCWKMFAFASLLFFLLMSVLESAFLQRKTKERWSLFYFYRIEYIYIYTHTYTSIYCIKDSFAAPFTGNSLRTNISRRRTSHLELMSFIWRSNKE